jgi:hypothetical protein
MFGVILMVVLMALVLPIGLMLGGAVWAGLFGFALSDETEHAPATAAE